MFTTEKDRATISFPLPTPVIPAQSWPLFPTGKEEAALVTAGWGLNGHGAHPAAEQGRPEYLDQSREGRAWRPGSMHLL